MLVATVTAGARRVLAREDAVLAFGTDFNGVTTDHWEVPMGDSLVHVNRDPDAVDTSYDADIPILADVTVAGDRISILNLMKSMKFRKPVVKKDVSTRADEIVRRFGLSVQERD